MFSFLLGLHLGVEWLCHMGTLCPGFLGNCLFSTAQFYILANSVSRFQFHMEGETAKGQHVGVFLGG